MWFPATGNGLASIKALGLDQKDNLIAAEAIGQYARWILHVTMVTKPGEIIHAAKFDTLEDMLVAANQYWQDNDLIALGPDPVEWAAGEDLS